MTHEQDQRAEAARQWASAIMGVTDARWAPASADASFRRYFRLTWDEGSAIVMDAPPAQEDCRPFVDVAARLAAAGLHVPAVRAQDLTRGFLLLDDLGTQTWLHGMPRTPDAALAWFAQASAALVQAQLRVDTSGLPTYDTALLERELALFPDWFVGRHLGRAFTATETALWGTVCERLLANALAQPTVFVHRDFMPRNLMVSAPNPGVLDFQDAVRGPISYDVISLFKDAFLSWPQTLVDAGLATYWQQARDAGLPVPGSLADFCLQAERMGTQRHLKVLGIFARIRYRDGKPAYLEDAPRFIGYLRDRVAADPQMAPLGKLMDHLGLHR
ncbi:aminoglycoside phosphotransferase family protein [Polycyclovorans algicola]|uniref:aminoglycoside phosphotransferase family protein n=1 Tax=Polycyclovorans algicola TaxID=616992 RepID=UPI0004A70BCF|nr:phosphotransferase [Polycyclovorans algicola]